MRPALCSDTATSVICAVFGLQSLLPLLSPGAAIVVTASRAGVSPYSVDSLYALSKHAVVGLVRSLAPVLGTRGVNIHALCPGDKTA